LHRLADPQDNVKAARQLLKKHATQNPSVRLLARYWITAAKIEKVYGSGLAKATLVLESGKATVKSAPELRLIRCAQRDFLAESASPCAANANPHPANRRRSTGDAPSAKRGPATMMAQRAAAPPPPPPPPPPPALALHVTAPASPPPRPAGVPATPRSILKSSKKCASARKNVVFGLPNVAEFHHTSPPRSMTPMAKDRAAVRVHHAAHAPH
jgi:hypothetical protein